MWAQKTVGGDLKMMSSLKLLVCKKGASESTEIKEPKFLMESRGRSNGLQKTQITHTST